MNITRYALMQHHPSGEVYAVRYLDDGHGTITGICGPLTQDERDGAGADYHYDDQSEDIDWAMAIGTDLNPSEALVHLKDI